MRQRIARQVAAIRHWKIVEADYGAAPDLDATWFVDPPYEKAGKHYRVGHKVINYSALGLWCYGRRGQVIACENVGASWLPFQPFVEIKANPSSH